jgi:hypothetical protein
MSATAWLRRPAGAWRVLFGLLVVAGIGCGKCGQVSGTVSYDGKPLPEGTVLLLASDGQAYHGKIGPDGHFTIPEVPRGEARVAVTSLADVPHSGGPVGGGGFSRVGQQAPMQSRIPMQYGDLTQSGLTATVTVNTTLDLDLK